jgi:hypothetical protein
VVADTYQAFVGRIEAQAQLIWEAPRSPNEVFGLGPTMTLQPSGDVQIQFPDLLWVDGRSDRTDTLTTFTVTAAVRAADATRLAWGTSSGTGAQFTAAVIDLAAESDYLNTQFELVYRTSDDDPRDTRRLRYQTRFEGTIPAELVTREQNRFSLALGRLPISNRYFQAGTPVEIELRIRRSLGSNSATQTLEWRGSL